jgi:hypothetical protein
MIEAGVEIEATTEFGVSCNEVVVDGIVDEEIGCNGARPLFCPHAQRMKERIATKYNGRRWSFISTS